jgi:hypothetical protein
MAALSEYNSSGLSIVTTATGDGGIGLNNNFKAIADMLDFGNANLTAFGILDMGGFAITNVGNIDGFDISAISLSAMPLAAAADINCNAQNITNVGTVDSKTISTLVTGAEAIVAVEAEPTLTFTADTTISAVTGKDLTLSSLGLGTIAVTSATTLALSSADTTTLTMSADSTTEKTLTIQANNADNTTAGADATLVLEATAAYATATATVSLVGDVVSVTGGVRLSYRAVTADYVAVITDHIIGADTSAPLGSTLDITLPAPSAVGAGWTIVVKDKGGTAATDNIVVAPADAAHWGDTGTNVTISANYGTVKLVSDNVKWYII